MEDTVTIKMSLLKHYMDCENRLCDIKGIMGEHKFTDFYDEHSSHFQGYMIDIYNKTIPSRSYRRMLNK